MANSTTTSLSSNLDIYYTRKLLDTLGRKKVIENLGLPPMTIPKGDGEQVKWLRYDEYNVSDPTDFLLSEGVVPTEGAITTRNLTATCLSYGNYILTTDKLIYTAVDDVIESHTERLGEHAGQLVELICRAVLEAGLPNQFANSKANLAATGAGDVLNSKEILKAVVNLRAASVGPHESGSYVLVAHPKTIGDIMNDTNVGSWVDVNKYNPDQAKQIMNGEVGKIFGCKVLESDLISSTTTGTLNNATVYSNLLLGKGCFGTVKLGKENVKFYTKAPGSGGASGDPIDQIASVGYKLLGYIAKYFGGSAQGTSDRGYQIRSASNF